MTEQHTTPPHEDIATQLDRLKFSLAAAQIGTWDLDIRHQLVWWDERCKQLYGFKKEDIVPYHQVLSYMHPDDRERVNQAVQWALDPQSEGYYDCQFRTIGAEDGQLRWLHCQGKAYFDPQGIAYRFSGIAQDITAEKRKDQALANVEQRFQRAFDNASLGIVITTGDGRMLLINQAFSQMTGYSTEELYQESYKTLTHPEDMPNNKGLIDQLNRGEIPYFNLDKRYIRKDGSVFWVRFNVTSLTDEQGNTDSLIGICQDITAERLLVEQLHQEQQRLTTILDQMPAGVLIADADGKLIYRNRQLERIFRHPFRVSQDIEAYKNWQLYDPLTDQPFDLESMPMVRTLRNGETVEGTEMKLLRGDGSWGYATVNSVPIIDAQGKMQLSVAAFIDSTARKQAEEALRQSEGRLRAVLESIVDGIYIGGLEGITLANQVALDQLGFTTREELNRNIGTLAEEIQTRDWQTGETIPVERQAFARALGGERVVQDVLVRHRLSGQKQIVRCAAAPVVVDGQVIAAVAVNTDVTELRQTELALRNSQQQQAFLLRLGDRLRLLAEPAQIQYEAARVLGEYLGANRVGYAEDQGDGKTIVVTRNYINGVPDLAGRYQYVDYGPTLLADFLAGKTVVRADIAHDPTLTEAEKEAHRVLHLGATVNKPLVKDGRLLAVLFIHYQGPHPWSAEELSLVEETAERTWASVERAKAGEALRQSEERYRNLSRELEDRVEQRTQELTTANQDLQRSNDNLQQFAYVASHDLQEPLRKIQSFSSLLSQQLTGQLNETASMYLDRINMAGARMSTLIKDLLSYSRIATRQQAFGPISLNAIVASVLDTLSLEIEQRQAQIQTDELPIVNGDASQLNQLFQNLLSNALKFTPAGQIPQIQIDYFQRQLDELPPEVRPNRTAPFYHQISVSDQGVGFDTKYLDRIFQVFQRLHSKNEFPGTGVGLAICQRVVENHGGGITASSKPGEGATFCVYLPA